MFNVKKEFSKNHMWSHVGGFYAKNEASGHTLIGERSILNIRDAEGSTMIKFQEHRKLLVKSKRDGGVKNWLPGENYRPCSRFKRLIHDSCVRREEPKVYKTQCGLCEAAMNIKVFPTDKAKKPIVVEEVWRGKCPPENPQIQQVFENWLSSSTLSCRRQGAGAETKETKSGKPHHYYHHILIKIKKPPKTYEKFLFCADCPDRYRAWTRNAEPDHYYDPLLMLTKKTILKDRSKNLEEASFAQLKYSYATEKLKETLKSILQSKSVSTITVSL